MIHRKWQVILILLLVGIFSMEAQVAPVPESPIQIRNPRLSALGGAHAALTDDVMTILNNPAGFCTVDSELLISELTLGLTGPIFDITSIILKSAGSADLLNDPVFLADIAVALKGLYANIDLLGPIAFAYAGNGISFGLFNWLDVSFDSKGGLNLDALFSENLLLTGGYCFRIPIMTTTLDIGLQLKALLRGTIDTYKDVSGIMNAIMSADIMNEKFIFSIGGGIDLGLLYSAGDFFAVGLVARNLYTPTLRNIYDPFQDMITGNPPTQENGIVPLDLSGGVKISPPLGFLDRVISDLHIYLDYQDILDFVFHAGTTRHWLLHLSLGLEFNLLEKLSLRGGFGQGLFSAGIGLDLTIFTINASMFGSEIGSFPGMRPAYNLIIGLNFKI